MPDGDMCTIFVSSIPIVDPLPNAMAQVCHRRVEALFSWLRSPFIIEQEVAAER